MKSFRNLPLTVASPLFPTSGRLLFYGDSSHPVPPERLNRLNPRYAQKHGLTKTASRQRGSGRSASVPLRRTGAHFLNKMYRQNSTGSECPGTPWESPPSVMRPLIGSVLKGHDLIGGFRPRPRGLAPLREHHQTSPRHCPANSLPAQISRVSRGSGFPFRP